MYRLHICFPISFCTLTHSLLPHVERVECEDKCTGYGVATISRLLKIVSLFCRISSLSQGSFAKETNNFMEPTTCSHPIYVFFLISCCTLTQCTFTCRRGRPWYFTNAYVSTYLITIIQIVISSKIVRRVKLRKKSHGCFESRKVYFTHQMHAC